MLDSKSKKRSAAASPSPQASPAPTKRQRQTLRPKEKPDHTSAPRDVRSPATRDPERTSAAILAAAIAEFSEKGFGGARIDAIAERAGINKRMLYHYFGDKDALYARALREIYGGIRSAERELKLESLDPVAGIRQLATFTWRYFLKHPEFLSMLATENLNRASFLRELNWASTVNSPLVTVLGDVLRRGAETGVFRSGLDPVEVYVTMTGIGYFYLSNQHTMSVAFAKDFKDPQVLARWGDHMAEVVLAWLTTPAADQPEAGRKSEQAAAIRPAKKRA